MATAQSEPKSGFFTSEFALSFAVIIAATVLRLTNNISDEMWALATGINAGGYTIARAVTKVGAKK